MNMTNRAPYAPRRGVDAAIRTYQRHLSPRKGFTCAYLAADGRRSCSAVIRSLVAQRGVLGAILPSLAQFRACGRAASELRSGPQAAQGICCCGGIPIPFKF